MDDKDGGKIVGKGATRFTYIQDNSTGGMQSISKELYQINYTISIYVKDGRYKLTLKECTYQVIDFSFNGSSMGATPGTYNAKGLLGSTLSLADREFTAKQLILIEENRKKHNTRFRLAKTNFDALAASIDKALQGTKTEADNDD